LIILICNPAAKAASEKKIDRACRYLRGKGYEVEPIFTRQRGDAEQIARNALGKNPSLIIAAGGDGTFNEVMNGLAGSEIPMAIFPLGTTNVLARELGVPAHEEHAMDFALSRRPNAVALGKITLTHCTPPVSRYFCLMAGIGFDGDAVHGISEPCKQISGKGAYIFSGIKTLFTLNLDRLQITVNGKMYPGYSSIIGKASRYGGDFKVTPDANLADPSLTVCIFQGKGRADILRYVLGIATGRHLNFGDVHCVQAKTVQVTGSAHIQIDGDYLGMTPAAIEVVPDIIRLVY
jgi:diacylglycerol kinase (ATP)